MSQSKKISSEIIHKNPWWDYKKDRIIRPDGSEGDYFYAETPGNAVIIPVMDDGRLLLVREYRVLHDKYGIQFPGGAISPDEGVLQAARRELLEETGYASENLISIGMFEPSVGMIKDMSHVFIANELALMQKPEMTQFEHTELFIRRIDEFEDMIKRGEVWNGQTLAAWTLARDLLPNTFR